MTRASPPANAGAIAKSSTVDYTDYIILAIVAILSVAWFTKGKLWALPKKTEPIAVTTTKAGKTRNIVERMRKQVWHAIEL